MTDTVACDGVPYNGTCIRLLYHIGNPVNYNTANTLCLGHGGKLVDIDSNELFYKIYAYLKQAWIKYIGITDNGYVNVWLAMRYQVLIYAF